MKNITPLIYYYHYSLHLPYLGSYWRNTGLYPQLFHFLAVQYTYLAIEARWSPFNGPFFEGKISKENLKLSQSNILHLEGFVNKWNLKVCITWPCSMCIVETLLDLIWPLCIVEALLDPTWSMCLVEVLLDLNWPMCIVESFFTTS